MLNITAAERAKDDRKTRRRGWYALATGLNTSFVVCYLICKPPSHTLSLTTRLVAPIIFIVVASIAGIFGTWMMLPTGEHDQLRTLSRIGLHGWIFLPPIAILLHQGSPLAPLIAVISAILIAISIHRLTAATNPTPESIKPQPNLFTTEIQISPSSWLPLALSLCLYAAFAAAAQKEIELVTLLLAIWTLVVTLQIKAAQPTSNQQPATNPRPNSLIAAALCCAFIALSLSTVWHDRYLGWSGAHPSGPKNPIATINRPSTGYQTIVLWPLKKPEKVIPSPPVNIDPSAPGTGKAWIIPFYGPYWYFKVPGDTPGPNAQTTHADPLKANIVSTDRFPLLMDAHQYLASPIDLTCCREIQVVFRNDPTLGALAVALSLTDSQKKRSQSLGVKLVAPTQRSSTASPTPTEETLIFSFPKSASITKFDAITVTLVSTPTHSTAGRRVAIEKFIMIPN